MANTLLTTSAITNYTLARFMNNNVFIPTANRSVETEMMAQSARGYKWGDAINIRRRNRFIVSDGQVANIQPVIEQSEQLIINHQYNVMLEFNSFDLTLKVDQFYERYIAQPIQHLISTMTTDIAQDASYNLNYYEGTPGTPLSGFGSVDNASAKMMELAIPLMQNVYCAVGVRDGASLKNSLANFFNPTLNEDITQESMLGHLSVFDMFQTQNIYRQIAGNFGAGPITTTAAVGSGSIIPMTGLTASTIVFRKGDRFSVAGVKSINPLSYQANPSNMQFVVTADTVSTAGGAANVPVSPAIISDLSNPNRNVSNAIPNAAVVTPLGDHNVNVAYISRALDLVAPPKENLLVASSSIAHDPEANIAIRLTQQGDIKNDVNAYRLDILTGSKWHPEYAIVLVS